MKNPKSIHPLAAKQPAGKIVFIHSDGIEHCYYSVVNKLSGSRLSAFDGNAPTVDNSIKEVRTIFNTYKENLFALVCL